MSSALWAATVAANNAVMAINNASLVICFLLANRAQV
jgi:hypothetical protein